MLTPLCLLAVVAVGINSHYAYLPNLASLWDGERRITAGTVSVGVASFDFAQYPFWNATSVWPTEASMRQARDDALDHSNPSTDRVVEPVRHPTIGESVTALDGSQDAAFAPRSGL